MTIYFDPGNICAQAAFLAASFGKESKNLFKAVGFCES
jgi:hypothetical protein